MTEERKALLFLVGMVGGMWFASWLGYAITGVR